MKEHLLNDTLRDAFIDFLNEKFKDNEIDFKQLIDSYKSIKDSDKNLCSYRLLRNEEFFEELIKNNRLTQGDLKYLLNRIDEFHELASLSENTNLLKHIVDKNLLSFKELIDKFKNTKDSDNDPCLYILLYNAGLFNLIQNNVLNKDDLRYLWSQIDDWHELDELLKNTSLLKYIVDKDIVSFKELVDKFKNIKDHYNDPCLYGLLKNEELFEELIDNNVLNKEDTRYLLNKIDNYSEVSWLCDNSPLTRYILNEFILNKKDVDRFNTMIENSWRKDIHTIFEYIEFDYKNNEEILKLNELNEKIYVLNSFDLSVDQKLELIEVLRDNEIARNRLIQIIDSNLESNYDFESLMKYLKKQEKKSMLNI